MKRTVKAICVIRVQVDCPDTWSEETTMGQIIKQAEASAKERLNRVFLDAVTPDANLSCNRQKNLDNIGILSVEKIVTHVVEER